MADSATAGSVSEMAMTAATTRFIAAGIVLAWSLASSAMLEMVSMPVKATMPTGIAIRKSVTVGEVPKSTLFTRVSGESTRIAPRITMPVCVIRSRMARRMFSLAASWTPITLTTPSMTTTAIPTITSAGLDFSGSQNTPR
jgi:hypothetical protein